ncbi:MAG: hypothetical protein WBW71_14605 [Bacteroidota bacterium]
MLTMFRTARAKQLCFLILLGTAACRDVGVPDVCRQKISSRLLNELSDAGVKEQMYRVVIRLSDSTGITKVVPSITVANNSIATGFLTAAEIRKVCVLRQVLFIDLPKRYHQLEQK